MHGAAATVPSSARGWERGPSGVRGGREDAVTVALGSKTREEKGFQKTDC